MFVDCYSSHAAHPCFAMSDSQLALLGYSKCICCGSILLAQILFSFVFGYYGIVWWWFETKEYKIWAKDKTERQQSEIFVNLLFII